MSRIVNISAPAKINLHLTVIRKRDDGYHDLFSIFQIVSLADSIQIHVKEKKDINRIICSSNIPEQGNIVKHALDLFRSATGVKDGIIVYLTKRIPVGAGLGGGSSDAAATLMGLNYLFDGIVGDMVLKRLAIALGSDVPFFLNGAAAIVEENGITVRQIQSRTDYELLLVYPGFAISTHKAFEWYDENEMVKVAVGEPPGEPPWELLQKSLVHVEDIEKMYLEARVADWNFKNSFYEVVSDRYPEIDSIRRQIEGNGAVFSSLSGSGSSVFGVFNKDGSAEKARCLLENHYPFVKVVQPLARKPSLGLQ